MKRNGRNMKMPKGVGMNSDTWSQLSNNQRYGLLTSIKNYQKTMWKNKKELRLQKLKGVTE